MHYSLSRYDYCDIMFSTLCLHKKIVGSDILQTALCSRSQKLCQWVQQTWNTRSGAAKGLKQPGRFPHSPEKNELEVGTTLTL